MNHAFLGTFADLLKGGPARADAWTIVAAAFAPAKGAKLTSAGSGRCRSGQAPGGSSTQTPTGWDTTQVGSRRDSLVKHVVIKVSEATALARFDLRAIGSSIDGAARVQCSRDGCVHQNIVDRSDRW
ncbi:Uncharacterised protein [Mycobacteroides abscessus subsp. massiliense]|nr:Uncharacterised protein [Mycobacteroides abscessus subsp. massiliense]SKH78532.1 Uncharacterised protein [Mycobacteroides abscessus subsp. massiliense]SKK11858.1 Uncharacterised protein [Mycobacteroides abscessus subsp. massiliense]SKK16129.1 Uncharacterised protein [Mycobacteroides abscessus subsp. massiliense]SKL22445.1 Uncharacterised protein [Mycobacteroides abscessus subsp. massiliense]